jgi:hypothetical protein
LRRGLIGAFCITCLLISEAGAQSLLPTDNLLQYLIGVKQSPYTPIPESLFSEASDKSALLTTLAPYFSDSTEIVRSRAYTIAQRIGQTSNDPAVRQRVVHYLVGGIRDKSGGISGMVTASLTGFAKDDISSIDRDSIGGYIRPGIPHLDEIVKLAGYLELTDFQDRIKSIAYSSPPFKYRWAARLALARMGDEEAISDITARLERAVINDDVVYEVTPDLVYTRQKAIFRFLEDVIHSDAANCGSADPDSNRNTLCGYRVMELIAPAIHDFPIAVDHTGDLLTNDYSEALTTVRTWLRQNREYVLRNDQY